MMWFVTKKKYDNAIQELNTVVKAKEDIEHQLSSLAEVIRTQNTKIGKLQADNKEAQETILKCAAVIAPYINKATETTGDNK